MAFTTQTKTVTRAQRQPAGNYVFERKGGGGFITLCVMRFRTAAEVEAGKQSMIDNAVKSGQADGVVTVVQVKGTKRMRGLCLTKSGLGDVVPPPKKK